LSGPLLDRIDMRITLHPIRAVDLAPAGDSATPSAVVAARVGQARKVAEERWAVNRWRLNAEVPGPVLRKPPWQLPPKDTTDLRRALDLGLLSARGFDRVLRLAWTLADLGGRARPERADISEAIQLRMGESHEWAE